MNRRRQRTQLNDEAASYVRELIMSGQIQSGQFIRPDTLAETLGMSATPVREGLLSLRGDGFLLLEPRRGFVVAPLEADDIRDVFRAQALLAGELAARACMRFGDEQLAKLTSLQERLNDAVQLSAAGEMESLNHQFHRLINTSASSPKLSWALSVLTRNVPARFYSTIGGWPQASKIDHASILKALYAIDAAAAREATEDHFDHAGELLAAHFERMRRADRGLST